MEPEYEVKFYDLPDGTFPAYEFIEAQHRKMNAKIYWTIALLEEMGPSLRMPYSESLGMVFCAEDGMMELTYRQVMKEKLKDPDFKKEWDELEPELQLVKAMLHAREDQRISQRQLSDITGITQADISKMESGEANPTLHTLKRIAKGLGMKLEIAFRPVANIK